MADPLTREEMAEDDLLYMMRVRNEALKLAAHHSLPGPGQDVERDALVQGWLDTARDGLDREIADHALITGHQRSWVAPADD